MAKIKFNHTEHGVETVFEYNQIDDNIFIGTNMCCQTHFKKELLDQGITADISLEEERLDSPFGVVFFCWLPTKDHFPPTLEQLQAGVDFISSLVKQNQKIYIHCKNGHGRAPTLVTAYYISTGLSLKEAVKKIQEKRSVIHIEDPQLEALENFEKKM